MNSFLFFLEIILNSYILTILLMWYIGFYSYNIPGTQQKF